MTTRLARAAGVLAQELDGELLLLRPGSSDVLHLDAVASQVWWLLEEPLTSEELVAALADGYGVPGAQVAADLRPALDVLQQHGLVVATA